MPTIARIGGIGIRMFAGDHPPPHFHVAVGGVEAQVRIADGTVIVGELTPAQRKVVAEWARKNRVLLDETWARLSGGGRRRR